MGRFTFAVAALCAVAMPAVAYAQDTGSYGDVETVNSGPASNPIVFELTAHASGPGYAGLYIDFTSPTVLSDITQLSADYQMTVGSFVGGAPRFSIFDMTGNSAHVFWGTPQSGGTMSDPNPGVWASTGNYADLGSSDLRVSLNGFGGDGGHFPYRTWGDFVGGLGGVEVDYITLDLDASWASAAGQQMLTDNFTVNDSIFSAVPEPATWAMMIAGFGMVGGAMRSRRVKLAYLAA